MSVKITNLELENVKRVRAVQMKPTANGLTVIGGKNEQGKSSVLDAISWALGGDRYRPSEAKNNESVLPPSLKVELSNGIIVERKGKNSSLTVTDPTGKKAGQTLLNSFIEELALNLPKFMEMSNQDKARTLLQVIGMEEEIFVLEEKEQRLYEDRLLKGREKDQKQKYADELPSYPDAPKEKVSVSELIKKQQEILAKNGENQRKRNQLEQLEMKRNRAFDELANFEDEIERIKKLHEQKKKEIDEINKDLETAKKSAEDLEDESTAEIEESISNIEMINKKVQTNFEKETAQEQALELLEGYRGLTEQIENTRKEKLDLLAGADLPLEGLSVADSELTYKGQKWDNMSGSEQLKVSTAIVRALNPDCGFVLMDKLEQMDEDTMKEFGEWLEQEELQVIATRVTTREDECQLIIEDGLAVMNKTVNEEKKKEKEFEDFKW